MAYKVTAICDRCAKEETHANKYFNIIKNEWQEVRFEISQYELKVYLFCVDCRKALGLINENSKIPVKVESVADRLFDCISEIVSQNMPAE